MGAIGMVALGVCGEASSGNRPAHTLDTCPAGVSSCRAQCGAIGAGWGSGPRGERHRTQLTAASTPVAPAAARNWFVVVEYS